MSSISEERPQEVQANTPNNDIRSATREAVQLAKKHGLGVAYPLMITASLTVPFVGSGTNCWGCG